MDKNEMLSVIEGMLFLSGDEGLSIKQITQVLDITKKEATLLMDELANVYDQREVKGFELVNFGGIYKLATLEKHHSYYQKMYERNDAKLSNAAFETLAIIAYNQPVTRLRIEEIRGVSSDTLIRKLVAKSLIKEVGREESPGKPILYGVTDEFMDAFHLTTLDELPKLEDVKEDQQDSDIYSTKYQEY